MKLLYCPRCFDVFNLRYAEKTCQCGFAKGRNRKNIGIYTNGVPLELSDESLLKAIKNQSKDGGGEEFSTYVLPNVSPDFVKVEENEKGIYGYGVEVRKPTRVQTPMPTPTPFDVKLHEDNKKLINFLENLKGKWFF